MIGQPLSPREQQVIDLLIADRPRRDIAIQLGVSPRTVETYLERIADKLGCRAATHSILATTLARQDTNVRNLLAEVRRVLEADGDMFTALDLLTNALEQA